MNTHFNKLATLAALLLFASKGKAEAPINLNREKISQVMVALKVGASSQPGMFREILKLAKPDLEAGLNLDLTDGEYSEIRKLARDLSGLGVRMDSVTMDELYLSTQEYSAK